MPLPREHGAWFMLALPFLSAVAITQELNKYTVAAAACAAAGFTLREPLIILARQRFVWREARPETAAARSWLLALVPAFLLAAATLFVRASALQLAALGAVASILTGLAVYVTLRNRQRSTWFQIISASGVSLSALLACLSAKGTIEPWAWWVWCLFASHSAAGVLTVHARLAARIASRKGEPRGALRGPALPAQFILLAGALGCVAAGKPLAAGALAVSAGFHLWDLWQLEHRESLDIPLRRIGYRAVSLSVLFCSLVIAQFLR